MDRSAALWQVAFIASRLVVNVTGMFRQLRRKLGSPRIGSSAVTVTLRVDSKHTDRDPPITLLRASPETGTLGLARGLLSGY